jgi:hypothetical protein
LEKFFDRFYIDFKLIGFSDKFCRIFIAKFAINRLISTKRRSFIWSFKCGLGDDAKQFFSEFIFSLGCAYFNGCLSDI